MNRIVIQDRSFRVEEVLEKLIESFSVAASNSENREKAGHYFHAKEDIERALGRNLKAKELGDS